MRRHSFQIYSVKSSLHTFEHCHTMTCSKGLLAVFWILATAATAKSVAVTCDEILDFTDQGAYCNTNWATKNYISCSFQLCPHERVDVRGVSTAEKYLFLNLHSGLVGGMKLQHHTSFLPGDRPDEEVLNVTIAYDAYLAFEQPSVGECQEYEARLGCLYDTLECAGYFNITISGTSYRVIHFICISYYNIC